MLNIVIPQNPADAKAGVEQKVKIGVNYLELPTKTEEITAEYLTECTKRIKLAEHYAIIALVQTVKLYDVAMSAVASNKKDIKVGITPLLAKINENPTEYNVGDIILINNSEISRGEHIYINASIAGHNVQQFLINNEEYRRDIVLGKYPELRDKYVKIIEFKVVPVCNIHASYSYKDNKEYIEFYK